MKASSKFSFIFFLFLLSTTLVTAFFAVYFYKQYKQASTDTQLSAKEIDSIRADVEKLTILPDEEPVIATVTDVSKLEQQAFFKQAQNGDRVLIFQKTQKAILYRPSINKIVDITVLNTVQPATEQTQTNTTPATVTVYNGTTTTGMAAKVQNDLKTGVSNISIDNLGSAAASNYAETIVVAIKPEALQKANEIAAYLNATVKTLPAGEQTPATDILVIVGTDKVN